MPDMYEIYEMHADRYDELVRAEDYQGNLRRQLHDVVDWRDLHVLEGGVGTGRVTQLYIGSAASAVCCDRAGHMLDMARRHLLDYSDKLEFVEADNLNMPEMDRKHDVFIEGWSFGHAVTDCPNLDDIPTVTDNLVYNASNALRPGGTMILVETMGTNVDQPAAPSDKLARFYSELEQKHGFTSSLVRTDYRFSSNAEAARVMGFFFGDVMRESVRRRGTAIIPEWTGLWTG
jgi:Methyltransferase domain